MSKNTLLRKFGSDDRDGTGLILANLDAERTSRSIPAAGGNLLVMGVIYTRTAGSATTVSIEVDESDDDGTNWYTVQAGSTTSGVVTLTDAIYRKAVTATLKYSLRVNFAMPLLRIRVTSAGGVTAKDQASITADVWHEHS